MGKRKTSPCRSASNKNITLASLDAALDMLATDTFTRLDSLISKFELAAGIQVAPGQAKARWEEAVKRYWVMRSMEVLSCSGHLDKGKGKAMEEDMDENMGMVEDAKDENGRIVPKPHLGPVPMYGLCPDEEQQWRRWSPKVDDVVLVDLPDNGVWPGKIIDRKTFFQGRSTPKGNHFFPVRIYGEGIEPCITIKSRLLPFHLRPSPPLLASAALQSAYHHATSPSSFDVLAHAREIDAAHNRCHPGVGRDSDEIKKEKEKWNGHVNWVLNERRAEKMRYLAEEREKKLASITLSSIELCPGKDDGWEDIGGGGGGGKKKRKSSIPLPDIKRNGTSSPLPNNSIFGPMSTIPSPFPSTTLGRRTGSPALIRPGLSTPSRPISPRRTEKRRSVFSGIGEYSPGKGRGSTWTPPRILPSGDETAPGGSFKNGRFGENTDGMMEDASPVPTGNFDFVSPLGPVRSGKLNGGGDEGRGTLHRSGSVAELEVVREEAEEEEGWTLVSGKRKGNGRVRAGSAPCQESRKGGPSVAENGENGGMEEDMDL